MQCAHDLQAGVANTLIYTKLRDRLQQYSTMEMTDKRKADIQRMKRYPGMKVIMIRMLTFRTCWLLISMVTIFLVCWLPLNIFNFAAYEIRPALDNNMFFSIFALCHLFGNVILNRNVENLIRYYYRNDECLCKSNSLWISQ